MKVRYNKTLAIALFVVGVLIFVVSLLSQQWITVATGVIVAPLGIAMLVNPMLRIEPYEVQLRNPLGMTLKRFAVTSPADLSLKGGTLRYARGGKKIVRLGFGVDKTDLAQLRSQLAGDPH